MATFGPQAASGATDDATIGTISWSSPGFVTASDDSYATAAKTAGTATHYLNVTFDTSSLPSFSSLDGIQIDVEASKTGAGTPFESAIRIVKNGAIGSTNKSTGAALPAITDAVVTYGATNDTWGETWSNGDTIGVVIAYTLSGPTSARVDYVSLTVTYTAGGGGTARKGASVQMITFHGRKVLCG